MSEAVHDARYLDLFPGYLRALGEDAASLGTLLTSAGDGELARHVAAGLNYIFKSLDLIPDGIDDLGYMDDAFVLRVAAALAMESAPGQGGVSQGGVLERLAKDAADVRAFLGADYPRLEDYVKTLRRGATRGRTVEDIVTDEGVRRAFTQEVSAWAQGYQVPSFTRDPKTLIKLKAFLNAKLA